MKKIFLPTLVAIIYTVVMALGWLINPYDYGTLKNVIYMIPILFGLSVFSILIVAKSKIKSKPNILKPNRLLLVFVIIIGYLLVCNFLAYQEAMVLTPFRDLSLLLLATMLVGIGEEFTYRGYIFNALEKYNNTRKALLYSSILFGLLHSVNVIAGVSLTAAVIQVILTTAVGYAFGALYLRTGRNLILIAVLHGLYDFLVFHFTHLKDLNGSTINTTLTVPLILILWIMSAGYIKKNYSK